MSTIIQLLSQLFSISRERILGHYAVHIFFVTLQLRTTITTYLSLLVPDFIHICILMPLLICIHKCYSVAASVFAVTLLVETVQSVLVARRLRSRKSSDI